MGVVIVDEYGARIDASQFAKEGDPQFNKRDGIEVRSALRLLLTPNFVLRRRLRHSMRQWSDDASSE